VTKLTKKRWGGYVECVEKIKIVGLYIFYQETKREVTGIDRG
jgi:hypothetical protein